MITWFFLHMMYVDILMLISYIHVAVCVTCAHIMKMILNSIVNVNDPQERLNLEY